MGSSGLEEWVRLVLFCVTVEAAADKRPGYPMARNLRKNLPESDKLVVFDVNKESTSKFVEEVQGAEVAEDVREVAEKS
ncbi:hypothetical protein LTR66_009626, partial [Elasticomyces elasticus]